MVAGLLITIREGMEAFLMIGILLGYLTKINQARLKNYIWTGAGAAFVLSVLLAFAFQAFAIRFEGEAAEIFEGAVASFAASVLTWMILWMQRQSRGLKGELELKIDNSLSQGQTFGLAGLAFFTVLREGIETALFISAVFISAKDNQLMWGAISGLVIAAGITYLIFRSAIKLNLRNFFKATGSLMILIAAGLVGHSVMALQEIGWIAFWRNTAWDIGWIISNDSFLGRLLHVFIGYDAAPSIFMIAAYSLYTLMIGGYFIRTVTHPAHQVG